MGDLVQTKPKNDMISSHSPQRHPHDRAAPELEPHRLRGETADMLHISLPCADGLTTAEARRRGPLVGTGLGVTTWLGSHRCRGSGTASARLLSSQTLSWMSPAGSQGDQTHQSPQLPAPRSLRRLPGASQQLLLLLGKFRKAAGARAGSARCRNSPTPPRGAPQDEEEPSIPSLLLRGADFAGEKEEKEVFIRFALRKGHGVEECFWEAPRSRRDKGEVCWSNWCNSANVGMSKSNYSAQIPWFWGNLGWLLWSLPQCPTPQQQVWGPPGLPTGIQWGGTAWDTPRITGSWGAVGRPGRTQLPVAFSKV